MIEIIAVTAAMALLSEQQRSRVRKPRGRVLEPGRHLFHGTIEDFDGPLEAGVDGLVWFADSPNIAQLYIPASGSSFITGMYTISRPSKDPDIQALQKLIGIEYDLDDVRFDYADRPTSFPSPKGWRTLPTTEEVKQRLIKAGFEVSFRGSVEVKTSRGRILMPTETVMGRLFVCQAAQPLVLLNFARDTGDLQDPQHLWIDEFRAAQQAGYDGVIINDYAQSDRWGNLGHFSVGVFPESVRKIQCSPIPASYHEFDYNDVGTPALQNPPSRYFRELALERKMA